MSLYLQNVELARNYDRLWAEAQAQLAAGTCVGDEYLAGTRPDDRRGISLIARLPSSLYARLAESRAELRERLPEHYLVPDDDLHVTVLSLEPVRSGFVSTPELAAALASVVDGCVAACAAFPIEVSGLAASTSAVMTCGYPGSVAWNQFRDALREACRSRGLAQLVDTRYPARGAHTTLLRFVEARFAAEQLEWMRVAQRIPFGSHVLSRLELVTSDWYLRRVELHRVWELGAHGA